MHENAVDEFLRDIFPQSADRDQPAQDQSGMQSQKLEPAVESVWRLQRLVKRRAPGRGHDLAAKMLDEGFTGASRAPAG